MNTDEKLKLMEVMTSFRMRSEFYSQGFEETKTALAQAGKFVPDIPMIREWSERVSAWQIALGELRKAFPDIWAELDSNWKNPMLGR